MVLERGTLVLIEVLERRAVGLVLVLETTLVLVLVLVLQVEDVLVWVLRVVRAVETRR